MSECMLAIVLGSIVDAKLTSRNLSHAQTRFSQEDAKASTSALDAEGNTEKTYNVSSSSTVIIEHLVPKACLA